ncbi:required for excision 1-B domain-containing protein [Sarcophilus harrisii]|uniref:Required for excision 1-B domain containing n=1 Tax=Sarcophilus harrisii TaxID=9305 RepID=G3VYH7_SARHA|nr:required for excision 1-B domain-containing protein [Sarcophilus harrisii]
MGPAMPGAKAEAEAPASPDGGAGVPGPEEPARVGSHSRVRDLLLQLQGLQAERSEAFGLLDQGHQAYLSSGPHYDFPRYRQLVHEVTKAFASISREVLAIQKQLKDTHGRPDLAQHLASLQDQEHQRLELTAALQLARQKAQEEPEAAAPREEVQELRQRIIKTMEVISEIVQDLKYDSEETE